MAFLDDDGTEPGARPRKSKRIAAKTAGTTPGKEESGVSPPKQLFTKPKIFPISLMVS